MVVAQEQRLRESVSDNATLPFLDIAEFGLGSRKVPNQCMYIQIAQRRPTLRSVLIVGLCNNDCLLITQAHRAYRGGGYR